MVGRLAGWLNNPPSGPPISRPAQKATGRIGAVRAAAGDSR